MHQRFTWFTKLLQRKSLFFNKCAVKCFKRKYIWLIALLVDLVSHCFLPSSHTKYQDVEKCELGLYLVSGLSEAFILHSFGTHSLCFILGITVSIRLLSCRQQRMDSCNKEFIGRIFIANFLSYETQEMSRRAGRFWHQNHSMSHAAQSSVENITGTTAGCHQERILCCSWCRSRQVHLPGHA